MAIVSRRKPADRRCVSSTAVVSWSIVVPPLPPSPGDRAELRRVARDPGGVRPGRAVDGGHRAHRARPRPPHGGLVRARARTGRRRRGAGDPVQRQGRTDSHGVRAVPPARQAAAAATPDVAAASRSTSSSSLRQEAASQEGRQVQERPDRWPRAQCLPYAGGAQAVGADGACEAAGALAQVASLRDAARVLATCWRQLGSLTSMPMARIARRWFR
jgi:hypothetical protein